MKLVILFLGLLGSLFIRVTTIAAEDLTSNYRSSYQEFTIKKSAYEQFGTYAAEQELVKAVQQMLVARDKLWIEYWDNMKQRVQSIPRAPEALYESFKPLLSTETEWLKDHITQVEAARTLDQLRIEAKKLNDKRAGYEQLAFQTNAEVVIGYMYAANEQGLEFNQALVDRARTQIEDETLRESKLLGLSLTETRMSETADSLTEIRPTFVNQLVWSSGEDLFLPMLEKLPNLYDQIKQNFEVSKELTKGLTW